MKKAVLLLISILGIVTSTQGQILIPEQQYDSLYTIHPYDISSKGDVVYRKIFGDLSSQYFLKTTKKNFQLPQLDSSGSAIVFYTDTLLIAGDSKEKALYLINPINQKIDTIKQVPFFKLYKENNLLVFSKEVNTNYLINIVDLKSKQKHIAINKTSTWEELGNTLIFTIDNQVSLFDLKSGEFTYLNHINQNTCIEKIIYLKNKELIAVIYKDQSKVKLTIYNTKGKLIKTLALPPPKEGVEFIVNQISFITDQYLCLSYNQKTNVNIDDSEIELWYTNKPFYTKNIHQKPNTIGVLNLKNNSLNMLNSTKNNTTKTYEDSKYYVQYNPDLYNDKTTKSPFIKLTVKHLEKPNFQVTLDSIPAHHFILSDPHDGIFYFKDKNWYFHNLLSNQTSNLTQHLDDYFYTLSNFVGQGPKNRIFISAKDNKTLYVSGTKNIYVIKDLPTKLIPITNANSDTQYSISSYNKFRFVKNISNQSIDQLDDTHGVLLEYTSNDNQTQALELLINDKATLLTKGDFKIDNIIYTKHQVLYNKTKQNTPPSLHCFNLKSNTEKLIIDTSDQLNDYLWSKTEIIHYQSNNKEQKGVLYYPAEYNPSKKYPLIVDIYEKKFKSSYTYLPPTYKNSEGVNYNLWTQHGYFVLSPDIDNYGGNPGSIALETTLKAVEKVAGLPSIDTANIGLIGHSFGGFEVGYIIARTNLFKTAISGAGVHNAISEYLSVKKNWRMYGFQRFENQIFKINNKLQDDIQTYSDITNVINLSNVSTPVLLWAGFLDTNVSALQSFEYFTGLKRLNKKAMLLNFKKEDHVLLNPSNQKKLTLYVLDWFDYHLKGIDKHWIEL